LEGFAGDQEDPIVFFNEVDAVARGEIHLPLENLRNNYLAAL